MQRVAPVLAEWATSVRWERLPQAVQDTARLLWLDSFGCMLLGSTHPDAVALRQALTERGREGRVSSAVGTASKVNPWDAALINGFSTGADVYDSGNTASRGHVAGLVMPAVITEAEATGASWSEAMAAYVVGYEVGARIGSSQKIRDSMHNSGTWNVVGAATAIGYLRGMNASQLTQVMELAANLTLTTSWDAAIHGANVRTLYQAMPAYLGLLVADLVPAGIRGGPRSIEVTFSTELSSQTAFNADRCTSQLGERWLMNSLYMKRYPGCHSFFASLDALFEAKANLAKPFDPATDVVRVGTQPLAYKRNREVHNDTELAARESLPVNVAIGLTFGDLDPRIYRNGDYGDPRILPLAKKIVIEEEKPQYDGERPGWAEIRQPGAPPAYSRVSICFGDPENPHPPEVVHAKFVKNAEPILGGRTSAVAEEILHGGLERRLSDLLPGWMGLRTPELAKSSS